MDERRNGPPRGAATFVAQVKIESFTGGDF